MSETPETLAVELETYQKMLPEWQAEQGRFAVIAGDKVVGIFDTYRDALSAGYAKRGLDPFLVKQISNIEPVANFTRNLRPVCHTSLHP